MTTRTRFSLKIFSTPSTVRTNIILVGKCDSNLHSTTSFSKNVVVAKTSYKMLGILFSDWKMALPPSMEICILAFVEKKKYNEAFQGVHFKRMSFLSSNLKLSVTGDCTLTQNFDHSD